MPTLASNSLVEAAASSRNMRGFEPYRCHAATRLSGPARTRSASSWLFLGLARLSLLGACLLTLQSCLVDDPPPFPESSQTPPRLNYHDAVPPLDQVIVATSQVDTIKFTIPVASEDAGERVVGFLLIDYRGEDTPRIAAFGSLEPSTLTATDRPPLSLGWQVSGVTPGCHRLTLRVGHVSSLPEAGFHPTVNATDIAEAYWWMNVDTDPALGNSLTDCPLASRSQP